MDARKYKENTHASLFNNYLHCMDWEVQDKFNCKERRSLNLKLYQNKKRLKKKYLYINRLHIKV